MPCELEQKAFDEAVAEIDAFAEREAKEFAERAELETRDVAVDLEDDDDLATTVGTAAGAAAGGYVAGAPGAWVGGMIGREVGKLFEIDIVLKDVKFSMDVPQFKMERRDISFDVPEVTMRNRDIIFHTPSVRMKRIPGPPKPEITCSGTSWRKPIPKCTVRYSETWWDIPEPFMQEQRIVLGVPDITMKRNEVSFDVPTSAMKRQEFSFKVPSVTVKNKVAEAKKVESKAKELSKRFEREGELLTQQVKELSKERLVPALTPVFACHRQQIMAQLDAAPIPFDSALASIAASLSQLTAQGVPAGDDDYVGLLAQRDKVLADRAAAIDAVQAALKQLDDAEKQAVEAIIAS